MIAERFMKKLLILFTVITTFAFAQKSNPSKPFTFKIEGNVRNFEGSKIFLHHKWDEVNYTDSTKVSNGKFSFTLKSSEPNMYWFTTNRDINNPTNCIFFVDESTFKVTIIGDSIGFSKIEGGKTQADYLDYRAVLNNIVLIQQKMQADFNVAMQNNDINAQNAIRAEYQNLNATYINSLKNFIKTHPKSAVSGFVIYNDFNNPNIPLADVEESLSYIDPSIRETKFIKLANKRLDSMRGTTVGYKANEFSQNNPDGKKINLSDFRGQYVLIDFWASWCRPCRMENPNVVSAYNKFKDKGFTVLGVSMDSNREPWLNAIQQDNLTWTHVSDLKGWGNEVGKLYGVTGIPQNYLIDKEGKIVAKDLRGQALDDKLAEILK